MGAWGLGIFDDDAACDVRGIFEDAIAEGQDVNAATQLVLEEFGEAVDDVEDGPVIWLALASLQLEQRKLHANIRQQALAAINPNLERWQESGPEDAAGRKRVLEELRGRIEQTP